MQWGMISCNDKMRFSTAPAPVKSFDIQLNKDWQECSLHFSINKEGRGQTEVLVLHPRAVSYPNVSGTFRAPRSGVMEHWQRTGKGKQWLCVPSGHPTMVEQHSEEGRKSHLQSA